MQHLYVAVAEVADMVGVVAVVAPDLETVNLPWVLIQAAEAI